MDALLGFLAGGLIALFFIGMFLATETDRQELDKQCSQLKRESQQRKKQYVAKVKSFVSYIKQLRTEIQQLKKQLAAKPAEDPFSKQLNDEEKHKLEQQLSNLKLSTQEIESRVTLEEKWHLEEKRLEQQHGAEAAQQISREAKRRLQQDIYNDEY